jgi:hypothetical protein
MKNPSILGVSLLIVIAATTMVGSSSANSNYGFHGSQHTLSKVIASVDVKNAMQAYQRQINTISISRESLEDPHVLSVRVPAGASLAGQIDINNEVQVPLSGNASTIDISPYLTTGTVRVTIAGSYTPASETVSINFEGPDTLVQQNNGGTGQLNYQLVLVVK